MPTPMHGGAVWHLNTASAQIEICRLITNQPRTVQDGGKRNSADGSGERMERIASRLDAGGDLGDAYGSMSVRPG